MLVFSLSAFGKEDIKTKPSQTTITPKIIIDPGHGGKDPGAQSKNKIKEKDLVLSISKKIAQNLKKKLSARVVMTRSNDTFISLDQRNLIANKNQCDVFLSIHANASTSKEPQGIEIYYLNKATDSAASRLAARENKGSTKKLSDVDAIISDLIQTASTEESADFAKILKSSLEKLKKQKLESVKIKTALFYVLVGAKCPSILLEVGFVTNPQELKRLKKGSYQQAMADAVTEAIRKFLSGLSHPASNL